MKIRISFEWEFKEKALRWFIVAAVMCTIGAGLAQGLFPVITKLLGL